MNTFDHPNAKGRYEKPVARTNQAPISVRVIRNMGQSIVRTANQAKRVGRDIADVAQAARYDPQNAAAKSKQLAGDTNLLLKQMGGSADPRVIGGGFAGLAAGDVMGRAVGGAIGTLVAGPAGALVGAEVGGFTAAMLGMKLVTDATLDYVEAPGANQAPLPETQDGKPIDSPENRKSARRMGEAIGITSGAAVGSLVAGLIGGVVGTVLGQVLGGQVGQETIGASPHPAASPQAKPAVGGAELQSISRKQRI